MSEWIEFKMLIIRWLHPQCVVWRSFLWWWWWWYCEKWCCLQQDYLTKCFNITLLVSPGVCARWQLYIFIFHCCQDVTSSSMWPPAQIGEEIIQINKLKRVNVYAWVNLFCSKLFWLCSQQNIYRTNCCWQDASLCSRTSCYLYQNHTMR